MDSARESAQTVKDAVVAASQSGTEPPSGVTGAGTVDHPYDQGNAPEQAASSGQEPVSGATGKGTEDSPYDQGNVTEQVAVPGKEPVSGVQGKGTIEQPYDQGNQTGHDPLDSPSNTHQGSGNPTMEPTKEQQQAISESRGRDEAAQKTTSTPQKSGHFDASKKGAGDEARVMKYEERDVSPGELRDGSHAVTSGARGENYNPGKMNKLKDKFGIGRDKH